MSEHIYEVPVSARKVGRHQF